MQDKGALLKRGAGLEFKSDLSQSKQAFQKRLWSLQSGGATALGPAVALGVAMAAEVPGSSILVATDGLANIGVGNLEGATSGEQVAKCKAFYEDMAEYARAKSVTINVLSLASVGDNVNLSILGVLNDITGGTIDLVQPATVVEQVDELMKAEPVATDVTISILSHRLFKFRSPGDGPVEVEKKIEKEKAMRKEDEKEEEEEEEEQNAHVLKKSVGVASKLSEILFEFEQSNDSSNLPSHLPFQVCFSSFFTPIFFKIYNFLIGPNSLYQNGWNQGSPFLFFHLKNISLANQRLLGHSCDHPNEKGDK